MNKFIPAEGRILVLISPEKEESEGGIIFAPSTNKNPISHGVVIAKGDCSDPIDIGFTVHFLFYSAVLVKEESEDNGYFIVKCEDVLCWEV